jgi:tetratricopeptide (TPR) repeat protein
MANGGQPELALASYSALLTRAPGSADVLLGRGIVYARLGRWSESEADLAAAAKASPDYADVWEALGNTYRWSEQPAKALDAAEHLEALRPNDPNALVARARAQRALGHAAQARADLERPRALGADAGEIDGLLAELQPRAGSPSAASPSAAMPSAGNPDATSAAGYSWAASLAARWTEVGAGLRWNGQAASLARYFGDFYVHLRHQSIVLQGSHSTGERLLARWYYAGDADNYLELSANSGRSDDPLSLVGGRARSGGGGVNWVRYFTPQWGGRIGATFSRSASGAGGNQRGLSFALYRRW